MERLNDEGQWIVLMGFMVCVGIFFLAIIIAQSTVVGQTTSEGVLEFPKNDIQDLRSEMIEIAKNWEQYVGDGEADDIMKDLVTLSMVRKNTVVKYAPDYSSDPTFKTGAMSDSYNSYTRIKIHFNNGVTEYDETFLLSRPKTP